MPISKQEGENRDEFISRCISEEMSKGHPQDQSIAMCIAYADENFSSATSSVSDATWSTEAPINVSFGKIRRVIFNEDFDEDIVKEYKEKGFKVQIRSSRKIHKKDKKVWNKLRSVGLTEDALVYGELRDLNKKYDYELMFTGEDPMLEKLMAVGSPAGKYLNVEVPIHSMEDAINAQDLITNLELRFVTVSVVYNYRERPGVEPAKSGSRPFCSKLMATVNKDYTLDEIRNLPTSHLKKMGLPEDPFVYRGGFYTTPGGVRGIDTTPFCRHEWVARVKIN